MIKEAIQALVDKHSLTTEEAASVMEEIMEVKATSAQIGAFITALRLKGETVDEIVGLAKTMRAKAVHVNFNVPVVDTCGTGGDGLHTFNISTAAAFVAAGAGLKVAKHGNRAASSQCGSADVLEALGVKIDLNAEQVKRCMEEVGIGFMFAPIFHPAMKYAAAPRREIGIRTVFNILGPLTNPAGAEYQVIGVPDKETAEKIAHALCYLGAKHALVVRGLNGMDEISITGRSLVSEVRKGELIRVYHVSPRDFGLKRAQAKSIVGGTPLENAGIIRSVLGGEKSPRRDVVLMHAAAVFFAGDKTGTLQQGIKLAAEAIDSGRALQKLEQLVQFSNSITL